MFLNLRYLELKTHSLLLTLTASIRRIMAPRSHIIIRECKCLGAHGDSSKVLKGNAKTWVKLKVLQCTLKKNAQPLKLRLNDSEGKQRTSVLDNV